MGSIGSEIKMGNPTHNLLTQDALASSKLTLHPFQIKWWDEAGFGGFAFLDEGVFNSDSESEFDNLVIFMLGNSSVQLGYLRHMRQGSVLVHNTNVNIVPVGFIEITQDFFGILGLAGQKQVAYNHTTLHHAGIFIKYRCAYLTKHFTDGFGGNFEVVGRMGIGGT